MSQPVSNPPPTRSWRDIPQPVKPRIGALGREGKKRLAMAVGNVMGLVLVLGASVWGVYEVVNLWETDRTRITAPTKGAPIRDFALRTDGVLNKDWVEQTLALPKGASLMEVDLVDLKRRLEESGQVSKAVLERRFPDVLVVTLQERAPVTRVVALIGDAPPVSFMVARDGMVYSGHGYDSALVESLPYVDGVKLVREGAGFARLEGMEAVADLLGTAQSSAPSLYRTFKVVSLARFKLDRTLTVKSSEVDVITFGASHDGFFQQLARLDFILEETRRQNATGPLKSVNLAIGDKHVPISFETAATGRAPASSPSASRPSPSSGAGLFSPAFRNSSPTQRDF